MTVDSKLVLRWEIDNAKARFATGKVESEVFDERGFKWTMMAEKDIDGYTAFALKCDAGHNGEWKCDTEVEVRHYEINGKSFARTFKVRVCFNANSLNWNQLEFDWSWSEMTLPSFCANDKTILEYHVKIINSGSGKLIAESSIFAAPNEMSNVILKIGDEKLHASKEFLAVHSPVFKTMFFGEFAEKGKEEVEINDVVYEEFLDLLNLIHFKTQKITDRTVVHILKLADRFEMRDVLKVAKMCLTESKGFDVMVKLLVSDQYNLSDVKEQCLQSFKTATDVFKKIMTFSQYDKLSSDMKVAICDRMKEL